MMFNTVRNAVAATAVVLATTVAAQAATVTFGMGEVTQGGTTDQVTKDGITMTVTAAGGSEGKLTLFSNDALGVGDGATGPGTDTDDLMRGNETLTFSFNPAVNLLTSVFFESGGGTDTVQVTNMTTGLSATFKVFDQGTGVTGDKDATIDFASELAGFDATGGSFMFQTLSSTGSNRGVAILGVSVEIAPVPLPAGMALMLTALGGLAVVRRKATV